MASPLGRGLAPSPLGLASSSLVVVKSAPSKVIVDRVAARLREIWAAVRATIISTWSNGRSEGQITKLKLVKRQTYGRAKFDLLEARLVGAKRCSRSTHSSLAPSDLRPIKTGLRMRRGS